MRAAKAWIALAGILACATTASAKPLGPTDCPKCSVKLVEESSTAGAKSFVCIPPGTKEAYATQGNILPIKEGAVAEDGTPLWILDRDQDPTSYGLTQLDESLKLVEGESMPAYLASDTEIRLSFNAGKLIRIIATTSSIDSEYRLDLEQAPEAVEFTAQEPMKSYRRKLKIVLPNGLTLKSWTHFPGFSPWGFSSPLQEGMSCEDSVSTASAKLLWTLWGSNKQAQNGSQIYSDALAEISINGTSIVPRQSVTKKYNSSRSPHENAIALFAPAFLRTPKDIALDAAFDCFEHILWRSSQNGKKPMFGDRYDIDIIRDELRHTKKFF